MGIDPVHIINHDLYFKHTDELIQNLKKRTGLPVFESKTYTIENKPPILPPENFEGWNIYTHDGLSLNEYFNEGNLLEICLNDISRDGISMYINPFLFADLRHDDFYLGRWSGVKYLADWIRENGIPPPEYYKDKSDEALWIFQHRKNYFEFCSSFGGKKQITFCSDKHGEWLEYFAEKNWDMEQFINWGKKEFIYVKFQDLINFDFPEKHPDYYNVFIEDDFEDLQQEYIKWKQPLTELYFSCPLKNSVSDTQAFSWMHYLIEEAAKWKLSVNAELNNSVIEGQVLFMAQDFSLYLAKHFITSFFNNRGIKVEFK